MTRHIKSDPGSRMRLPRILPLAAALAIGTAVLPAESAADITKTEAMEWSHRIAETWMVDQRCGLFSNQEREEYEWHAREISRVVSRQLEDGTDAGLQLAGETQVAYQKDDCGPETRRYLQNALADARNMSAFLTKRRFRPGGVVQQLDLQKFAMIEVAAMVELRCHHLSDKHEDEFSARRRELRAQIGRKTSDSRIKFYLEREFDSYFRQAAPCGRQTRRFVMAALRQAREMTQ